MFEEVSAHAWDSCLSNSRNSVRP